MSAEKFPQLRSIQVLRAIAALLVVYAHGVDAAQAIFPTPLRHLQGNYLENLGIIGVDVFFVISGFVIAYIVRSPSTTPGLFLGKRIARIYPIYYLFSLVALFLYTVVHHHPVALGHFVNSLLLLPVTTNTEMPILNIAWTLYFEMFFYLAGFLILRFCRRDQFIPILVAFLSALVLLGAPFHPTHLFLWVATHPLLLEFAAGCLIASCYFQRKITTAWAYVALAGAVLWLGWLVTHGVETGDPIPSKGMNWLWTQRAFYFGVPSALLVFAAVHLEKNGFRGWPGFAVALGDSSYCLYLSHMLIIRHVENGFFALGLRSPDLVLALALLAVLLIAHAIHLTIERPLHQFLTRRCFAYPAQRISGQIGRRS